MHILPFVVWIAHEQCGANDAHGWNIKMHIFRLSFSSDVNIKLSVNALRIHLLCVLVWLHRKGCVHLLNHWRCWCTDRERGGGSGWKNNGKGLQKSYLDLYVCLSKQEASAVLREMRSCWSSEKEKSGAWWIPHDSIINYTIVNHMYFIQII